MKRTLLSVALRTELKAGEIYLFLLKKKKENNINRKICKSEMYIKNKMYKILM